MNDSFHEANADIFWTAAQYAAGDLPAAAAEEFELRLEADQSAREALAQAVLLSQAVLQVESTPVVSAHPVVAASKISSPRGPAVAWIAVAASLLLAVVVYRSQTSHGSKSDEVAAAPTLAQQQLALAWAENQTDDAAGDLIGEPTTNDPMFDDGFDENLDGESPSLTMDPSAPDWLLAAVADAAAMPAAGGN